MSHQPDQGCIPVDILDDLSSRFIINIPEGERKDPIRLFFQIELAHWFYLDFHRTENSKLKSCGMKEFTKHILKHIPSYSFMLPEIDNYYDKWKDYKMSVPTYGAIVLNEDMTKVLLVQSYFERSSWGFPKGKVNEDEDPVKCAVREVLEETGCDIGDLIRPDDFLEATLMEQRVRLYVIHGVKETVQFRPQTRNEIKCVEWFSINDLPINKKDTTPKQKTGVSTGSFFMVLPFVRRIKMWIINKNAEEVLQKRRPRHKSVGDTSFFPPVFPGIHGMQSMPGIPQFNNLQGVSSMPIQPISPNIATMPRNRRQEVGNRSHTDQRVKNQGKDVKPPKPVKSIIRRQLFTNETLPKKDQNKTKLTQHSIPSWVNFKLDWEPLLKCFDI